MAKPSHDVRCFLVSFDELLVIVLRRGRRGFGT